MGHVIHVWEGPLPSDRDEAVRDFYDLARQHLLNDGTLPTRAVRAFVADVLEIWPEPVGDRGVGLRASSPFVWPASTSASGPVWRCQVKDTRAATATHVIAAIAERHGLNWNDPQPAARRIDLRPVWEAAEAPLYADVALTV
ncbi:hypothetical protein [Demequina globuliformis]|uniref:hypothetical protein n=1 Tax=Demequina globuliformis TaxID=676202 RepID=UPI00128B8A03|nr:hypothetical protein [Demequina globuliformis]